MVMVMLAALVQLVG
jgi:hypothetical protein